MGATSVHREPGMTDREFFEGELPETLTQRGEILACASVGNVFYAAVRNNEDGRVWALVVLMTRTRDYWNFTYKEMSEREGPCRASRCPAKVLDLLSPIPECVHKETYCRMCSREIVRCGRRWLSRMRPRYTGRVAGPRCWSGYPYGAHAEDGGAPFHEPGGTPMTCGSCGARDWRASCRANIEHAAKARAVTTGTVVSFSRELEFMNGAKLRNLTFEGRSVFEGPDGLRYRIPNWRMLPFEVVSA
jgi:hypothetical protein